jgi:cyclopropane fatty-acyl-phospholipid synthase-like methyltransferase
VTPRRRWAALGGAVLAIAAIAAFVAERAFRWPDVGYVATEPDVVNTMLDLARLTPSDVLYDLGCGDGRIVITAAKRGAHAVGIDIDPERIAEANANANAAGVSDRVQFLQEDLFSADISRATVVAVYLLPSLNLKLRPKLFKELRPGTRIVSHSFDMGDWKPEQSLEVGDARLFLWRIQPDPSM